MMGRFCSVAVILLIAGMAAGEAAPLVPSGDLPGRERYRFTPSPLDRFMQPAHRPSRSCAGSAASAAWGTHPTDRSATAVVEVGEGGLLGVITPPALFF